MDGKRVRPLGGRSLQIEIEVNEANVISQLVSVQEKVNELSNLVYDLLRNLQQVPKED